jgi:nitrogen-specific signal transduction histidine kinase
MSSGLSFQVNLFSPFNSTRPDAAGLSLYLAKGLMEEMGGSLVFDSSSPQTTFILKLTRA